MLHVAPFSVHDELMMGLTFEKSFKIQTPPKSIDRCHSNWSDARCWMEQVLGSHSILELITYVTCNQSKDAHNIIDLYQLTDYV